MPLKFFNHVNLVDLLLVDGHNVASGGNLLAGLVLLDVVGWSCFGVSRKLGTHHGREPVPGIGFGDSLGTYVCQLVLRGDICAYDLWMTEEVIAPVEVHAVSASNVAQLRASALS